MPVEVLFVRGTSLKRFNTKNRVSGHELGSCCLFDLCIHQVPNIALRFSTAYLKLLGESSRIIVLHMFVLLKSSFPILQSIHQLQKKDDSCGVLIGPHQACRPNTRNQENYLSYFKAIFFSPSFISMKDVLFGDCSRVLNVKAGF